MPPGHRFQLRPEGTIQRHSGKHGMVHRPLYMAGKVDPRLILPSLEAYEEVALATVRTAFWWELGHEMRIKTAPITQKTN